MSKLMILKNSVQYASTIKMKLPCLYVDMHFVMHAFQNGIIKRKKINRRVLYACKKWT